MSNLGNLIEDAKYPPAEGDCWTEYEKGAAVFRTMRVDGKEAHLVRKILRVRTVLDAKQSTFLTGPLGRVVSPLLKNWEISEEEAHAALVEASHLWKYLLVGAARRRKEIVDQAEYAFRKEVEDVLQRPPTDEDLAELIEFEECAEVAWMLELEDQRQFDLENPCVRAEEARQRAIANAAMLPPRPPPCITPDPVRDASWKELEEYMRRARDLIAGEEDRLSRRKQ